MVQLNIHSGKMAGSRPVVRHFPFRIGRTAQNELQLEDDGVWDFHLSLNFEKKVGFVVHAEPNALTLVNGNPVTSQRLRNGDILTLGSAKIQFWLAAARQRGLRARECLFWGILTTITAAQFVLLYWLIR